MAEQRKLPLDDDKTRLKLSIKSEQDEAPENTVSAEAADKAGNPEEEPMSVGAHLRLERERQELSLHEVAERLRLRAKQLQALEEGDYDSLPGQTFVIGFIRSYATSLGLDAIAVVDLYKRETGAGTKAPDLAFPEPTSEGRMPRASLMAGSAAVALLLFAGWYFYLKENTLELEIVQELPERLLEKITGNDDAATAPTQPDTTTSHVNGAADTVPAPKLQPVLPAEPRATEQLQDEVIDSLAASIPETDDVPTQISSNEIARNEAETSNPLTEVPVLNVTTREETETVITEDETQLSLNNGQEASPNELQAENTSDTEEQAIAAANGEDDVSVSSTQPEQVDAVVEQDERAVGEQSVETPASGGFQQLTLSNNAETDSIEITAGRDEPVALGVENAQARLVLMANQESWVQIKSTDGETVLDRIMTAGDTFMLPNRSDLMLNTANASGLELRLDGVVLGSLGSYGQIVRELPLKPEELKAKFSAQN